MFNSKFVPNRPERPANRTQANPENPLSEPNQRAGKVSHRMKGGGVSSNLKPRPDTTQNNLSQNTMKEDMLRLFHRTAKSTKFRARTITLTDLVSSGELTSKGLPEEDFNLRRNFGPPNARKPIRRDTSDEPRVQ